MLRAQHIQYRERVHIIRDLLLKLVQCGELNQTGLMSFCGLNMKKHLTILDTMEFNGFITRKFEPYGKRVIKMCKVTDKGLQFCNQILEPYEKLFPRSRIKDLTELPVTPMSR